ncbi:HNH endonuclease [Klebsiella aerogenes]|uniref:HNH endonuclease n=1 Tax=Klebsiella aerogenes TaxID=548 RepID=UPI000E2E9042|nr:HNH endonuclease [Klebsiella aerogenes]WFW27957.1 HNH endonuclease [Klebsiella aerogenes]HDU5922689.1 HNH endonuclease [Klebsiella aerogenes]
MIWVVYISDKPHSKINFPIGMNQGVWGVKETKKGTIQNIKKDDLIAFVYSISWLKSEGASPPGFSRVGKEHLQNFRGLVQKIIIGQVTRGYYTASTKVWPDDEIYPHRFDFKIVQDYGEDIYFGTEFFNEAFVEAVRYSACTQGSITQAISIEQLTEISCNEDEQADEESSAIVSSLEGKPITRLHQSRERDPKIIKQKKEQTLNATGKLQCEICSMDFEETYGKLGRGFAECHHKNPLSLRDKNEETALCDLAIVCSNCHRMLHRKRPWLTLDDLREIYENQKS